MSATTAKPKTLDISNPNKPTGDVPKKLASKGPTTGLKKAESVTSDKTAETKQDDIAKSLEKQEVKLKAINANNVARVANGHLVSSDDQLQPLVSLKTGKPIEKFPATSKEMAKLTPVNVDAILNALEADRSGNEEVKRGKLRVQLGLMPHPA